MAEPRAGESNISEALTNCCHDELPGIQKLEQSTARFPGVLMHVQLIQRQDITCISAICCIPDLDLESEEVVVSLNPARAWLAVSSRNDVLACAGNSSRLTHRGDTGRGTPGQESWEV